jgi:hypothetical protein
MRMIFLMAAAALTVASPAIAQNTTADTNASVPVADTNAADANAMVATDNAVMDANMPADVPVTEDVTPPAPAPKKDFPWGVLGLIGLVGLLGRKRG